MADKEPRRRKKRKDVHRKEDIRLDEPLFMATKNETRDSDQDTEEEFVIPTHQPSKFAKLVFVLLFSGLVICMSFVFISLQGAERGPVDIFDAGHGEEHSESHVESHEEVQLLTEHEEGILPDLEEATLLDDEASSDVDISHISSLPESEENGAEEGMFSTTYEELMAENLQETTESLQDDDQATEPPISNTEVIDDDDDDIKDETYAESQDDEVEENIFTSETPSQPQTIDDIDLMYTEEPDDSESDFNDLDSTSVNFSKEDINEVLDEFENYDRAEITNEDDYIIREPLDEIDSVLHKLPEKALKRCEELLKLHGKSPRLHYMKAQALDEIAEQKRSNNHLEDSILAYQKVLTLENVPEELYLLAGTRAADRMRFRGFTGRSLKILTDMAQKFPKNISIKKQIAVGYLLIGQNNESKKVLLDILKLSPESGFAKVHLGFILKTDEFNYTEAIKLMSEGISTKEPGVVDGRFYFHLGDALHRTGKQDEAMKVYAEGVKEGLFLSVYQRSLYNVNGLTGKPWWDPTTSPYAPYIKILERNWQAIKQEALQLLDGKHSVFSPESEGLQDKGSWKQLELFARGKKIEENCHRAPKTCGLISQIPDASTCKRGQVKFSIMHSSTHVWAHTGPTNCRLRAHLGLVIPDGAAIRVANETRKWEEGKVLLFDDSFEHEVWHNGTTFRLVLIVDFWHPELNAYQKRSLTPI